MSGYRFCRTDDVPLLVEAYNRCCADSYGDPEPWLADDFKRAVREIDLWASSCMVAMSGDEPVGVLMATKRPDSTLIWRVGVRDDHRRQGHGRHMVDSLSQKLAILGPPLLRAELPESWAGARAFAGACGFVEDGRFVDFELTEPEEGPPVGTWAAPIDVEQLIEAGAFDRKISRAWARTAQTLINRKKGIRGLAIADDTQIQAYVLRAEDERGIPEVVALGPERSDHPLLRALLHQVARDCGGRLRLPRLSEAEMDFAVLEGWGLRRGDAWVGCRGEARER